jgi:hypothetical protein
MAISRTDADFMRGILCRCPQWGDGSIWTREKSADGGDICVIQAGRHRPHQFFGIVFSRTLVEGLERTRERSTGLWNGAGPSRSSFFAGHVPAVSSSATSGAAN